jgi:hypothetical protein
MSIERIPEVDFARLAFELRVYARREAGSNEDFELFIAGLEKPSEGLKRTLADLRQSAELIGQASVWFSILSRHEAAVRALVASLTTPEKGT